MIRRMQSASDERTNRSRQQMSLVLAGIAVPGMALVLLVIYVVTGATIALVPLVLLLVVISIVPVLRNRQILHARAALDQQVDQFTLMTGLSGQMNVMPDSRDSMAAVYERVAAKIQIDAFIVTLFDPARQTVAYLYAVVGDDVQQWPPRPQAETWVADYVYNTRQPLQTDRDGLAQLGLSLPHQVQAAHVLAFPLLVDENPLGVLLVTNNTPQYPFTSIEHQIIKSLAAQISLSIRSRELRDSHAKLAHSIEMMNKTLEQVVFSIDRTAALEIAGDVAMEIGGVKRVAVLVQDDELDRVELVYAKGIDALHTAVLNSEQGIATIDMQAVEASVVADTDRLERGHPVRELAAVMGFRGLVQVPLRAGTATGGAIQLYYDVPCSLDHTRLRLLETLAYQVMVAIDNAGLLKALEVYAAEQAQLVHLSRVSTSNLLMSELVAEISTILRQMFDVDEAHIFLIGSDPRTLELMTESGTGYMIEFEGVPELALMRDQPKPNPRIFYRDDSISKPLYALLDWRQSQTLAVLPVVANEAFQGIITLHSTQHRALSDSEWRLAEMAANQIATQVHNSQLYADTQRQLDLRLQELSLIEDLARDISSAPDIDHIIRGVLNAATHATGGELAALALRTDNNDLRIIGMEFDDYQWAYYETRRLPDAGVIGRVIERGQPEIVGDNSTDTDYVRRIALQTYRSSLVAPLRSEGKIIGALDVESTQPGFFREEHLRFINNLAGHAVISIQNTQLLLERQTRIETLSLLRDMSIRLASDVENESVVDAMLQTALDLVQGEHAVLFEVAPHTGKLSQVGRLKSTENGRTARSTQTTFVPLPIAQQAVEESDIIVVEDVQHNASFQEMAGVDRIAYAGLIAAPIKHSGRVTQVLCVSLSPLRPYSRFDRDAIELLTIQASGHLENAALYQRIRRDDDRRRAILDSTRDGILMLDRDGVLIEANVSAESLLGLELNEFVGQHFAKTLMRVAREGGFQEESANEALREMARVLRLEPQRITTRSFEVQRGGTMRYIEEVGSPVFDSDQEIMGRLLTLRDVTEERLLAAYRDEITNMVVHDLRSPLGSIISSIVMSKEILSDPNDEMHDAALQVMDISLDSANHLMSLVDNLLDIAKLETRRMPLSPAPTVVRELAEKAYETLSNAIRDANVNVELAFPDDLPLVDADPEKLRRVLINLLDNAIRYTPSNSTVQIGAQVQGPKVKVHVADSGKGIPADARDRVFEKFTQIKGNKPVYGRKGTGLGLTFCKLVLEAHGERIWVEPQGPLPGASFAFTLPILTDNGEVQPDGHHMTNGRAEDESPISRRDVTRTGLSV